jgi:hydrogenase expression/formation protein HypE
VADDSEIVVSCPTPLRDERRILMAHGGGGRRMHQLIEGVFAKAFDNPHTRNRHDGATIALPAGRLAFTTDSYVVQPLFFPGGDIGKLAVCGTVNDLAMCGARPLHLSAGFILEEGLLVSDLRRIVESMQKAAAAAAVSIVTGDTKVVERGKGDGVFINTAGIGLVQDGVEIGPAHVRAGDAVLLSGDIGRHGVAVLAAREGLRFETSVESDCAPLAAPVLGLIEAGLDVHCLRDLTRGGLASALVEIAEQASVALEVEENAVSVCDEVRGACEILGFDPLYLANEGRFVVFVAQAQAERALAVLRTASPETAPAAIGRVLAGNGGVTLRTSLGSRRTIDMLSGEQLPRIC